MVFTLYILTHDLLPRAYWISQVSLYWQAIIIHTQTHRHTCTHTYSYTCTHIHRYTPTHARIYTPTHARIYTHTHLIYIFFYQYTYIVVTLIIFYIIIVQFTYMVYFFLLILMNVSMIFFSERVLNQKPCLIVNQTAPLQFYFDSRKIGQKRYAYRKDSYLQVLLSTTPCNWYFLRKNKFKKIFSQ